jgi:hypothetical protein
MKDEYEVVENKIEAVEVNKKVTVKLMPAVPTGLAA